MATNLSIYHPAGEFGLKDNPFGKDVANLELFRALAQHGGFGQVDILSHKPSDGRVVADELLAGAAGARIQAGLILNQAMPAASGALLRGQPYLYDLAWLRRRTVGDRAYSLIGLIHTLAPTLTRHLIAEASLGPVHPWDAVICTSPSVQAAMRQMFAEWGDYLAERMGGHPPAAPQLPVVPLGVDGPRFAGLRDRPDARARARARLGLGDDDILVLWVGRLSFYEKAYPQPMLKAVQQAADATGRKLAFAMAGWFPGEADQARYEAAARAHAPAVAVSFPDGNDRALLGELWAGADIFLSLVDNVQETFGITPLEAMAAGLPVVASDWDGYRYTMRDGIEAFLVPTLIPPAGPVGDSLALRQVLQIDTYQAYVGAVAQHTAVNVPRAAEAIADLVRSPDLRRRMGEAGRARVADLFDWPVVARAYADLIDELTAIRRAAPDVAARHRSNPVKGDPFRDFHGFTTHVLQPDQRLAATPNATVAGLRATADVELDDAFAGWRVDMDEAVRALELLQSGEARTSRDVLMAFPTPRRRAMEFTLVWMAKLGFVDWPTEAGSK